MTRDEAKQEVRSRFRMADGALQYGDVQTATEQLQVALRHVHEDVLEPSWWQGQGSELFSFVRESCPTLHRYYLRWLLGFQ